MSEYAIGIDIDGKRIKFGLYIDVISCTHNNLISLDLSNCPSIRSLYCYNNLLTTLDISNCPNLRLINCTHNNLTTLDVSNNKNLWNLRCDIINNDINELSHIGFVIMTIRL